MSSRHPYFMQLLVRYILVLAFCFSLQCLFAKTHWKYEPLTTSKPMLQTSHLFEISRRIREINPTGIIDPDRFFHFLLNPKTS